MEEGCEEKQIRHRWMTYVEWMERQLCEKSGIFGLGISVDIYKSPSKIKCSIDERIMSEKKESVD